MQYVSFITTSVDHSYLEACVFKHNLVLSTSPQVLNLVNCIRFTAEAGCRVASHYWNVLYGHREQRQPVTRCGHGISSHGISAMPAKPVCEPLYATAIS